MLEKGEKGQALAKKNGFETIQLFGYCLKFQIILIHINNKYIQYIHTII